MKDVESYPDAYQYERAKRLRSVGAAGIGHALKRLHITYKRKSQASQGGERFAFCQKIKELEESGRPVVFLDESGFSYDMPRTHGYAPKGKRCFGIHDWGAKRRTNIIGALLGGLLLTVTLFEITINTAVFDTWVQEDLMPKLPPQSIVILDNANFHKGVTMKKALDEAGHTLSTRLFPRSQSH